MKRISVASVAVVVAVACLVTVAVALEPPTLTTDVPSVEYPGVVTLTATATTGPSTAVFRMQPAGSTGYLVLGTVPVSYADSAIYQFIVRPRRNATYTVEVDGMMSEPVYVGVHVPLSRPSVRAIVRPGTTARITGTIRPFHPGPNMDVQLEKFNARTRKWERKLSSPVDAVTQVNADTTRWTYDLKVMRSMVGLWRVRASHKCTNHEQSYSDWRRFSVL